MTASNYVESHITKQLPTIIPEVSSDTIEKAARLLGLPHLLVMSRDKANQKFQLEQDKADIEATDEFQRASFLIDPKHGELTKALADKTSERKEATNMLHRFQRHPDFIDLKNEKDCGLRVGLAIVMFALPEMALGIISMINGSTTGAILFTFMTLLTLTAALAILVAYRIIIASDTASDLNCRNLREALDRYGKINREIQRLCLEIDSLRNRILHVQSLANRHRRISELLANFDSRWLCDMQSYAQAMLLPNTAEVETAPPKSRNIFHPEIIKGLMLDDYA